MKRTLTITLAVLMMIPLAALAGDGHGHDKKASDEAKMHHETKATWMTNEKGVVLDGYDPISYFQNEKPVPGKAEFSTEYEGATFWFASQENMQTFTNEPAKYVPQFGGHCAYAMAAKGKAIPGDPTSYEIRDGELLLFFHGEMNGEKVDAKKKWMEMDPAKMHTQAHQHWKKMHGKHHEKMHEQTSR